MKAMVLAAGLGTRLRPDTYNRSKALIDVCGQPMIDYVIAGLSKAGVDHFIINSYLYPEYLEAHMSIRHQDKNYYLSFEQTLLGTAGAMLPVQRLLEDSSFFLHNADILTDLELSKLIFEHQAHNPIATLVVEPVSGGNKYDLAYNDSRTLTAFLETGSDKEGINRGRYIGIAMLSPEIFDFISSEGDGFGDNVFPKAVKACKEIRIMEIDRPWYDIGTPAGLASARAVAGVLTKTNCNV